MLRAVQSAELLGGRLGLPVELDDRLAEREFGPWEGHLFEELLQRPAVRACLLHPGAAAPPGVESLAEVQRRAVALAEELLGEEDGGPVVLVTHADVIRALLAHVLTMELDGCLGMTVDNGSISIVERARAGPVARGINLPGSRFLGPGG
jgi:broad specificity phosphatase PhoE